MKKVKLNPECFKRHYPPHRAWYVSPDYDSLNPGMADVEWIVEESPENQMLGAEHGVQGIPNMQVFKDGKKVDELIGMRPEPVLIDELKKHL